MKRCRDGDTYDHSLQLHYRQFLVTLLFVDLPSLSPFITCTTSEGMGMLEFELKSLHVHVYV